MSRWNHRICERCWIERNTNTDGSVRKPVALKDPDLDPCCFCGLPTFSGIFVRSDPAKMRCLHKENDE